MDLKNIKLNNYNKMTVRADVEEKPEDIKLAIVYTDHGDDFVYVRTKDNQQFLYGYFLGRRCEPDNLEDLEKPWNKNKFLRNPVDFRKKDTGISNAVFWAIHNDRMFKGTANDIPVKVYSAQWEFDYMCGRIDELYSKGTFYNLEDREFDSYRSMLREWLELNEIATPENLKRLSDLKLSTKDKNGLDGIAAKKEDCIHSFDRIIAVFKDGKEIPLSECIQLESYTDEYGCTSYYFPLDQFEDDVEERLTNQIDELKDSLIKDIKAVTCEGASLKDLYLIRKMLNEINLDWHEYDSYDEEDEDD